MKRKLISQGINGLTIYLPKKWTDKSGLKAGDEVEITAQEKDLLLSSESKKSLKTERVKLHSNHESLIRSIISSAYKSGYDEIILEFSVNPNLTVINRIVNTFTGLEVTSQEKNKVTIKSFLTTDVTEVDNLILKLFQNLNLIAQTIDQEWEKVDEENLGATRKNVIKLRDHCLRAIHLHRYGGDKSYDYYDLVTQLEKLFYEFYQLGTFASVSKIKKPELYKIVLRSLAELYQNYLKKELPGSSQSWEKHHFEVREGLKVASLIKLMKKENSVFVVYYYNIMKRLLHLNSRVNSLSLKISSEKLIIPSSRGS